MIAWVLYPMQVPTKTLPSSARLAPPSYPGCLRAKLSPLSRLLQVESASIGRFNRFGDPLLTWVFYPLVLTATNGMIASPICLMASPVLSLRNNDSIAGPKEYVLLPVPATTSS